MNGLRCGDGSELKVSGVSGQVSGPNTSTPYDPKPGSSNLKIVSGPFLDSIQNALYIGVLIIMYF
jgi:hypothetical protein